MIYLEYDLDGKSLQEIIYRADNWINEGSGWVIKSVNAEYVSISIFSQLSGSSYIKLPNKQENSMKAFINIKNNANKYFLWCHIRDLNPLKIYPERNPKADKNMVSDLNYQDIEFLVSKKDVGKFEKKINICINVFCYKNNLVYLVYALDQKFKDCKDLLLIHMAISHTVSISKISTDLWERRQKIKIKNSFASIVYNALVVKTF